MLPLQTQCTGDLDSFVTEFGDVHIATIRKKVHFVLPKRSCKKGSRLSAYTIVTEKWCGKLRAEI